MLIKIDASRDKDKGYWSDITPNEHKQNHPYYRKKLAAWGAYNNLPHQSKMFEIRIVRQKSKLSLHQSSRWWDQPQFMDKTFWVFQKPVSMGVGDERTSFYALEYLECQRVFQAAIEANHGNNPFRDEDGDPIIEPSFLVPAECCEVAWEETSAGYSDHIRWGAMERKYNRETPEYFEREAEIQEKVKEISKDMVDISKSTTFLSEKEKREELG